MCRETEARHISSDSIPVGGFTPGTILTDRYRIIGLLGRGGMGEVYRADDLKLGQAVVLKFLPKALASDPVRRERFFGEVRITRQLSHPNICRVYDIAEADGQHFLSMEYVDGEDLKGTRYTRQVHSSFALLSEKLYISHKRPSKKECICHARINCRPAV
jgi:serine/threonine protein kinase